MQYYKLMVDGENSTDNIYAHPCIEVEDPYMFCYGKGVEKWEPVRFECDIKKGTVITEYLRNSYGWDIFSERALKLFGNIISDDVQLLPVNIINKDTGQEIEKYYVVNILAFLDALDLENSLYTYHKIESINKTWLSVIKYGLKKSEIGEHNIFRLKDSPMAVFVSEKFKKVVETNKMLGLDFLQVKTG
ncbi:MAG: hypothetical protein FWF33_01800 [Clostridiales bacterium]|nr:hypothetical protein [Clostridiales bacterium]